MAPEYGNFQENEYVKNTFKQEPQPQKKHGG